MSSSYDRRVLTKATISDPGDEIVISGISGRFPNSDNMHDFAYNLYNKVDMVDDDERRWAHTNPEIPKRLGKVRRIEKFDASFFSVHHRQANFMDPQCRMLLEHSYEAVLDAGINPKTLRESRTGVFMGCCFAEAEETVFYAKMIRDGLGLTGSSRAMLANRVSFALGLRGPSFMIDTACSSSMYALDCAFNAIRTGECDAALVGGTNLLLHPYVTLQFARLGVTSKDGYCRPFDKDASGYSRAEAVSVIFLQKKSDAKRIYADVIYSKTNNDGFKKEAITYPSGQMQIKLLKEFYNDLGMDPSKVDFVEAHSTGTIVGDPEECHTLDTIFCKGRNGRPLPVGSVKSNMGHSEATSGICSIAKVILTFENKLIPPNINFVEGRPGIPSLEEGRLKVVTENEKLEGPYICINSFGFGGGNAHSLFKANEKEKVNYGIPADNLPRLVIWSGRTEEAIKLVLDSVTKKQLDAEYVALLHSVQTHTISANTYRGYGIYNQNGSEENANCLGQHIQHFDGVKRPIVWVYSGMGSQWSGMGADLMKIPTFADSIERCHNILATRGLNLKEIITSSDPTMFDNILHSFVGIAAIQIGLTDILKSLGVVPDYIVGHSVGELGCAYADQCITAEEMILSSYSRGMASIETKVVFGSMAAVGIGYKKLRAMIPEGIEIACHNSADSCTISGPAEKVADFVKELKKQNYFAKEVQCSNIPYHSGYIAEMGPKLLSRLSEVIKCPTKRSEKWISSSVPKIKWETPEAQFSSAQYHTNNLLSSVLFEEACELVPKDALTIEIAPHGLLQAILKTSIPDALNIPLTKRGDKDNSIFLLNAIGRMFENGVDIDASKLYPAIEFPVSRGTPMISPLIRWDHSEDRFVTKYSKTSKSERIFSFNITEQESEFITGHTIDGRVLYPATGYLYLVWNTIAEMNCKPIEKCDIEFEDVKFLRATALDKNQEIDLNVVIQRGTMRFEINEGSNAIVTGTARVTNSELTSLEVAENEDSPILLNRDFYKELRLRGYHYNGLFRSVVSARADGKTGKIKWSSNWIAFLDCLLQLQIIGSDSRSLLLPTGLRKMIIKPQEHLRYIDALEGDEKILDVISSQELNLLRCGGIEMRGMQANAVSRRRPPGVPVLETYQFIPHVSADSSLSRINVARFCIQLALENIPTAKFLTVEIDSHDSKEPLSEYFGQALGDLPLITGDLNYLTSNPIELEKVNVQDCSLSSFSNVNFIIKSEALTDAQFLTSAVSQLKDGGFIVSREKTLSMNSYGDMLPKGLQMVAVVPSENEYIVLLQYLIVKQELATKVVKVTSENYDWIEELKQELVKGQVIAYAEKDDISGIIGLVNCIRKEPNGLNLKCVFIADSRAPAFSIENPFYKSQLDQGLAINVFKNGRWGSYRHLLLKEEKETGRRFDHCYANSLLRGDLSSLTWLQGPLNYQKPKQQIVKIQYSSLNFRDVMLATGKLTATVIGSGRLDQLCVLGLEFSGLTENKRRVMGMVTSGALATHIEADHTLLWDCPDDWTLEQAATVPVVYGTVYGAFFLTTKIEKGKSILIHAGSGGVGLAAIRVAFAYGLEVFTTVSTEEKKQFLLSEFPQLKRENIGNSRDISFEDLVMTRTSGKGVDYVLNSLADEKLHASIRCLGKGGQFLEIGKFDMANDTKIGLGHFMREVSFHAVLIDNFFDATREEKMVLRNLVQKDIENGIIKPLKTNVFEGNQVEQAFRFLASGKHMGKVLLKIRENDTDSATLPIAVTPRIYCSFEHSYIIPGGLGGFGLELADWLILRGCRKLVLSSSRGITKQYQAYRIKIWESYGVQVSVNTSNISTKTGCEQLIRDSMKLGPVGGIFNLAVILKDGIFENQDAEKFVECMAPKAVATKHLDELSRKLCPELQYFVVFSSVSCGRGNAGQSNYGMANSVMERIIEQRHELGLPAKAVQWGAVGEVGLVADMQEDKLDMEIGGTLQQRIGSCLEELDTLLTVSDPLVSSMVVAEKRYKSGGKGDILAAIMNIMSIRDIKLISMETTLSELGMDSLMTVEIQQTLEREYDLVIPAQELRSMNLAQLVKCANSRDSADNQSKLKTGSQNVLTGVAMLLRNVGDESKGDETILHLKNPTQDSKVKALIVPGIEGMAGQAWYKLAEGLRCQSYVLQSKSTWAASDMDSIYDGVIKDVLNLFKDDESFLLIGYSFGALLALKLSKALELQGKTGKVIFIDGSPKFLKALAKDQIPDNTPDEFIQALVLTNTINNMSPENGIEMTKAVLSEASWDSRISKLMELSKEKKIYSDEYGRILLNSLVNRLKLTLKVDLNSFSVLDKTPITLVRPSEFSILEIEDDYGLSSYTTTKVNVKYVEGNHVTVLDNPKLFEIVNSSFV